MIFLACGKFKQKQSQWGLSGQEIKLLESTYLELP